jgi:Ca2+-transporting ATPase
MKNWHNLELEKILEELNSQLSGLSENEAQKRILKYGENIIPEEKKKSLIFIFLKQFKNVFNIVLLFVLLLALFLKNITDALVVLIIILVNAFIGFFFELKTVKTLEKLKQLLKPKAKVLRDGEIKEIPVNLIVPGDIVVLEEGDIIPADLRFFEVDNLKVDESILTGESLAVEKTTDTLLENVPLAERKNLGFMGTFIIEGKGKGIVVATGLNTYLGSIYEKYQKIEQFAPHFEKLSKNLIFRMFLIGFFVALLILFVALHRKYLLYDSLLLVLSTFVSAIPEGLPVIINVLLVVSAYALYKKNILVKNLQATENLSVINLLLTDKTGTLTENVMTVRKIFIYPEEEIEITGEGYSLEGKFLVNNKEINILENYPLIKTFSIVSLLNEAEIIFKDDSVEFKGSSREIALLVLLEKAGIKKEEILAKEKILIREPFSRIHKHKKVVVEHERVESYYLGAFEKIIQKCNRFLSYQGIQEMTEKDREAIIKKSLEYANNGFSVLTAAFNEGKEEENLIFVSLIALYDSPKKGVKETIAELKNAGIDIRILTGDHKATAVYIAKEISFENTNALDEEELNKMSDEELLEKIKDIYIFARVSPEIKLRILELYQKLGYSVAYIGDGVNDVLNLKKAEVGIAMGKRGSEIAKSASDIILVNDNLADLTNAFLEGRKIFNNLKRVVFFLVTTNVAESFTILISLLLGYPFILRPTHILFLNFVTDTLIGTNLAFEKEHGKELKTRPKNPKESLISFDVLPFLFIMASTMAVLTIYLFSVIYLYDLEKARTYAFLAMSFTQLFNALNLRSFNQSFLKLNVKLNPLLFGGILVSIFIQYFVIFNDFTKKALNFSSIEFYEFLLIFVFSSIVLIAGELFKLVRGKIIKK